MSESEFSPVADTWPPSAEPAIAIPARAFATTLPDVEDDADMFGPEEAIPYSVTPCVYGEVPVSAALVAAVRLVDEALAVARANQPGVTFSDLAGAVLAARP